MNLAHLATIICLLGACSSEKPLPPIATGLPDDEQEAQHIFADRVQGAFPDGTSEANLKSQLSVQGFKVTSNRAELHRPRWPCDFGWIVEWRTVGSNVVGANGVYGSACP